MAESRRLGHADGGVHEEAAPRDQQRDASHDLNHVDRAARFLFDFVRQGCRLVVLRRPNHPRQERGEDGDEGESFPPAERPVQAEHPEEPLDENRRRHLFAPQVLVHPEGAYERTQADDEADVRDIRADDVADGDVADVPQRRRQTHHEFRRARRKSHDRQTDDERPNPHRDDEPPGPAYEQFRPGVQERQARNQNPDVRRKAVGRHPCLRIRILLRATLVGATPVRQAQPENTPGVFFGVLVESPSTGRERRNHGAPANLHQCR